MIQLPPVATMDRLPLPMSFNASDLLLRYPLGFPSPSNQAGYLSDFKLHLPPSLGEFLPSKRDDLFGFCECLLSFPSIVRSHGSATLVERRCRLLSEVVRDRVWFTTLRHWFVPDERYDRQISLFVCVWIHPKLDFFSETRSFVVFQVKLFAFLRKAI